MIYSIFILKDLHPLFSTFFKKSYSTYNRSKRPAQDAQSDNIIVIKDIDWTNRYQISKEIRESLTDDKKAFWEYLAGMIDAKANITFSSYTGRALITIYGNEDNLSLFVHIVNTFGGDNKGSYLLDNWYTKRSDNSTEICLRIYSPILIKKIAIKINGLIITPSKVIQFKKLCQLNGIIFKKFTLGVQDHNIPNYFFMGYFDMKGRLEIYYWNSKYYLKILANSNLNDKAVNVFLKYFKGKVIAKIPTKKRDTNLWKIDNYSSWIITSKKDHQNFLNYAKICPSLVKHSNQIDMIPTFYSKDQSSHEDFLEFQIQFNNK